MTHTSNRVFDFSRYGDETAAYRALIRQFAEAEVFRSAVVEELELDEDFYRRPVRPEDLSFIKFAKPVRADTMTRLPFFAAQRLLLAANELQIARLPQDASEARIAEATAFYATANRVLGARIRPFLEDFSFDFVEPAGAPESTPDAIARRASALGNAWTAFWSDALHMLERADYVEAGWRFALIQNRSLAPSKRHALALAQAAGFFDGLPDAIRPTLLASDAATADADRLALACGAAKQEHSYWQFYLSTSLAQCNLLHAFGGRPANGLRMLGASFAAEIEARAFARASHRAAVLLGIVSSDTQAEQERAEAECQARLGACLDRIGASHGAWGLSEIDRGLETAALLGAAARTNLGEQLRWLSSVERYRDMAVEIDARIKRDCPNIDRETFVEPREMCSTTHVHDDHRLVVIESGDMVFWGNLGMTLCLKPGEMVLVPQGRLHGSSILSDECTYHQPIIPDAWIDEMLAREPAIRAA